MVTEKTLMFPYDLRTPEEKMTDRLVAEHEGGHFYFHYSCPKCQEEKDMPIQMDLSIREIRDLAEFAGLIVSNEPTDDDELETEITISECGEQGLKDGALDRPHFYSHIAWFSEYPDEGAMGLGPEITRCEQETNICDGCGNELAEYETTKTCRNCAR